MDKNKEFTYSIWGATEDKEVLNTKNMLFEILDDTMDGVFKRVSDYTRFANRIEKYGITEYLTWISKSNKLKINNGYCTIVREENYHNEATLIFDEPIKVVVGEFDGEPIIRECTKLIGSFNYEWLWMRNGRQNKIANCIEISFDISEYRK